MISQKPPRRWWILWLPLLGASTAALTSLGISLGISVAYSTVYTASLGHPTAAELQLLEQLVPRIQALGAWGSYLLLFGGAYVAARRWKTSSLPAAMLMASGAWLGAAPFVIAYGGHLGAKSATYALIDFGVVAAGMALGRRVRESSDRLLETAGLIRGATSLAQMLDAIARHALGRTPIRVQFYRVEGSHLHLAADTVRDEDERALTEAAESPPVPKQGGLFRLDPDWLRTSAPQLSRQGRAAWGLRVTCPEGPNGLLVLVPIKGHAIARADREAWASIAEQLALAWHRQLLLEETREISRKRERERLSHEIHDGLAQDLISAVLFVETARQRLERDHAVADTLSELERIVRQCLATARELAWSSWGRPASDAGKGIATAIQQLAQRWSRQTSTELRFEVVGEEPTLSERMHELLLSATREGLNNVRKHANARCVNLTLTFLAQQLALDICDDGDGAPETAGEDVPLRTVAGGFGLTSLRQRVAEHCGQCVVESAPGEGFTLSIQLPLGAGCA